MLEKIGPFLPGEKVRANWLQKMLEALRGVVNITATAPLKAGYGPNGLNISLGVTLPDVNRMKAISVIPTSSISGFTATCWLCGPIDVSGNVAADRVPVWIQNATISANELIITIKPTNGTGLTYNPGTAIPVAWAQLATAADTHGMKVVNPNGTLTISGGGTLTGGIYRAAICTYSAVAIQVTGSTFTSATIISTGTVNNCYFVNLVETGKTTHDLVNTSNVATLAIGIQIGTSTDGYPVIAGPMVWPGCS